ncbi:transketolase [Noviherbaspirillum cavernae]|uniref:Transketolase n=1 Tax=Noviherbaspirillum cavernae TaxID=2320862 RepID=A0A418WX03_9BURK|nr:transketolase [Noviherbaspirillum cavernae]RJG04653.1 transketolase [Noviherbaspirillum cavernae]
MNNTGNLRQIALKARKRLLDMHYRAKAGHLGGNLSCLDALITLHHAVMQPDDRFVLSKGHAAGALYVTLWSQGKLRDEALDSFCLDNTTLPGHPSGPGIPGLMFSTGSLGHGPSLSAGLAMAARHKGDGRRIYCLCSDGEWQEGACWEALIFAAHQRLDNLTILIDQNGLQGFGTTLEVISCNDLAPRLAAFGATVKMADGHDHSSILEAVSAGEKDKPLIVILDTVKGRGLHYENRLESHYLPLSEDAYTEACAKINAELLS